MCVRACAHFLRELLLDTDLLEVESLTGYARAKTVRERERERGREEKEKGRRERYILHV